MPSEFDHFKNLLIALGLGLLVGLQREWAESPLGGIRSFSLTSLFGAVTAVLFLTFGFWIVGIGFIGLILTLVGGQIFFMKNIDIEKHRSLVTQLSFLLMFCTGAMAGLGQVSLAAAMAGVIALVLHIKFELHYLASGFDKNEIRSILQFVLLVLVIFPMIPDRTIGPYDVINPRNIWLMVVLIVGISLIGYIILKFFGRKAGIFSSGVLGGVISSTATTITVSKNARKDGNHSYFALIILLAWATLYGRVAIELKVVSPQFTSLNIPLLIMTVTSLLPVFWMYKNGREKNHQTYVQNNPTELRMALTFAVLYASILIGTSYLKDEFGNNGLNILALISGAVNLDAITLSTGRLVSSQALDPSEGHRVILLAILSNNFFKGGMTLLIGGVKLFKVIFLPWILTLLTALGLFFFY